MLHKKIYDTKKENRITKEDKKTIKESDENE